MAMAMAMAMAKRCASQLPEDLIIEEILPWLPVKSLLRFRCVSKAWRAAISDPLFIQEHRRRASPNVHAMVGYHYGVGGHGTYSVVVRTPDNQGGFKEYCRFPECHNHGVITSSHDLIAISHRYGYMLSNPATRDVVHLPLRPHASDDNGEDDDDAEASAVYYQPDFYFYCVGFGFVPSIGRFKVVRVAMYDGDVACQVLTVGADESWRQAKDAPLPVAGGNVPYLNGALHVLSSIACDAEDRSDERLLAFDLASEAWREMRLPDNSAMGGMDFRELQEFGGLLCCADSCAAQKIELWLLHDYDNEVWVKQFCIDLAPLSPSPDAQMWFNASPLMLKDDGKILLDIVELGLFCYDPRDKSFKEICGKRGSYTQIYAENLLPVLGL